MVSDQEIQRLIGELKSEDSDVRYYAAESLREIGLNKISLKDQILCSLLLADTDMITELGEKAIQPFIKALKDYSHDIRSTASAALRDLTELGIEVDLREVQDTLREFVKRQPTAQKRKESEEEAIYHLKRTMEGIRQGNQNICSGVLSKGKPVPPTGRKKLDRMATLRA